MLAVEQAGQTGEAATFIPAGSGYKTCSGHGAKKQCVVWDNVQAKGDRIANFTISGKKLADRLTVGNGKWVTVGSLGKIKVGVAYQSVQSGWLFVVFKMKAGAHPLSINQTDFAYVTKGGTQVTAGDWAGPDKLLPGAVGKLLPRVPARARGRETGRGRAEHAGPQRRERHHPNHLSGYPSSTFRTHSAGTVAR
jgi:hypothetical protein